MIVNDSNNTIIERLKEKISIVQETKTKIVNNINRVVSSIKSLHAQGMLVPIVCEDMYEYEDPITKARQSLHSYIVEKVIEKAYANGITIQVTSKELNDIVNEGYYGMSLLKTKIGEDVYEDIYDAVMDENNMLHAGISIKTYVVDFLKTADFPLIITTSCFPVLEKELGYESYWNEIEVRNDVNLPDKCIYHVFGQAKIGNSTWGYNDKQILAFLKDALSSNYSLDNLRVKIQVSTTCRKTLMILGNDAPNWLFRFILTPIYGHDVYDDGIGYYFNDEDRNDDYRLVHFLHEIKFKKETQLRNVLENVTEKIKKSKHTLPTINNIEMYDCFIAHASDDNDGAKKIVARMRDNGLKVWVDYENIKDGYYWQRIIDAIKKSKVFIPYITENYIKKNEKHQNVVYAFKKMGIDGVSFDMATCVNMEKYLSGVQIELLLADKWFENCQRDPYSIPIIQKGSTLLCEPITPERIKNISADSRLLPQNLFWGLQMYEFDEDNPSTFVMDWDRYKGDKFDN